VGSFFSALVLGCRASTGSGKVGPPRINSQLQDHEKPSTSSGILYKWALETNKQGKTLGFEAYVSWIEISLLCHS
jgi:hypothetical protein